MPSDIDLTTVTSLLKPLQIVLSQQYVYRTEYIFCFECETTIRQFVYPTFLYLKCFIAAKRTAGHFEDAYIPNFMYHTQRASNVFHNAFE
jgi:hypothetical protein